MNFSKEVSSTDFSFDELFFSRTDKKGIIQSGNSVFQRISEFEWDEILNKPHNVVRHPIMPRGIFYLLWNEILSANMVGAYVVNKTKNGKYYWVFALVTPLENGFLSVRLKPSSKIFQIIKNKYSEFLSIEKEQKISPEESHNIIISQIVELGFPSYWHFMVEALMQELESRAIQLKNPPIKKLQILREALKLGTNLQQKSEEIAHFYQSNAFISFNLEIHASRIGTAAISLATISSQYYLLAREIQLEINKFADAGKQLQEKIQECQFYVCNSILQKEIYELFESEVKPLPIDKSEEMKLLSILKDQQIQKASNSLSFIQKEFIQFRNAFDNVRNLSIALDMVIIGAKIETAKIKTKSEDIISLIAQLSSFKDSLKQGLQEIEGYGMNLLKQTEEMKTLLDQEI